MGLKGLFGKKPEEKPLTDSDLENWGASHITNSIGPFWAALGFDSEKKITDEVEKGLRGKLVFKSVIRQAQAVIVEKENNALMYSTCTLNGSVITFFPRAKSNSVFPVTVSEVREMGNLFEAFAELKVGPASLRVFLPDYLPNKEKYVKGASLDLALGGIALSGKPSDIQKQTFKKEGKPIKAGKDFAGIFPNNINVAVYSAVGTVDNKKTFDLNGKKLCAFRMKIINQPNTFVDLVGLEKNIEFPANKDQQLSCNLWLQAHTPAK